MRLKNSTGAPRFSAPNDGKHIACLPIFTMASLKNCPALTAPCPARECHLIAKLSIIFVVYSLGVYVAFYKKTFFLWTLTLMLVLGQFP